MRITEHSREGSDWVDDIQGHPRGRVTEDVRKFAAEQGITEEAAIEEGLKQKATEFNEKRLGNLREGMIRFIKYPR